MPVNDRAKHVFACLLIIICCLTEVAEAADFSGVWQGSYNSDYGGSGAVYANINQVGSSISGTLSVLNTECGDFWNRPLTGTVSGDTASFATTVRCDDENYSLQYTQGRMSGNSMSGYYTVSGPGYYDNGTFSLTKSVYTITAAAGTGGSITPSGSVSVNPGASQVFTITAYTGYTILNVTVDGVSVGALTQHTFTNVQSNHTISAIFAFAPRAMPWLPLLLDD